MIIEKMKQGYEYVKCDLCCKDNTEVVLIGKDLLNNIPGEFKVVRCKTCGFVYVNPRPYGEELLKYYPDDAHYFKPTFPKKRHRLRTHIRNKLLAAFWGYFHLANVNYFEKTILFPLFLLIRRDLEIRGIPPFSQNGKLIDVGCSYGLFLRQMKKLGWDVVGIDRNKKAADFGCKEFGLRIINDDYENINVPDKFDVIVMSMVLEHLSHPSKALEKAYSLLKESGRLIIIVPNFSGIEFRLFKEYCYGLNLPNHLNHFTPSTITKYCEKYGFIVEKSIHLKFDRDFVASAQYMKNDGLRPWLASILSNRLFRITILKVLIILFSYLGLTSRITVWARKV